MTTAIVRGVPASFDGGDVLWTVASSSSASRRARARSARAVAEILGVPFRTVPVADALHLKSVTTRLAEGALVACSDALDGLGYELVRVPDSSRRTSSSAAARC